jgi:hypothetical protein
MEHKQTSIKPLSFLSTIDLRTNHKKRDRINMEQKIKHLEFIQSVVNRMAANSFLIKGWCITLVSALFALAANGANDKYIIIAFIPVPVFWILDSYYLWQERLFRAMYDQIRVKEENLIDFSMDTSSYSGGRNTRLKSFFSFTLCIFYISLIMTMMIIIFLLNYMVVAKEGI